MRLMNFTTIAIGVRRRKRNALQVHVWKGFFESETIMYRRKAYKKARWRRAEQRLKEQWTAVMSDGT